MREKGEVINFLNKQEAKKKKKNTKRKEMVLVIPFTLILLGIMGKWVPIFDLY